MLVQRVLQMKLKKGSSRSQQKLRPYGLKSEAVNSNDKKEATVTAGVTLLLIVVSVFIL